MLKYLEYVIFPILNISLYSSSLIFINKFLILCKSFRFTKTQKSFQSITSSKGNHFLSYIITGTEFNCIASYILKLWPPYPRGHKVNLERLAQSIKTFKLFSLTVDSHDLTLKWKSLSFP